MSKKTKKSPKMVLIKDLVIPAGTVFSDAPRKTERSAGHMEAIIGLTKNTSGSVIYFCEDDQEELKEWFADLKE